MRLISNIKGAKQKTPTYIANYHTVKFLNFGTQENCCNHPKTGKKVLPSSNASFSIAKSEDPDQTAPLQSDLGLHYLSRPISPKT